MFYRGGQEVKTGTYWDLANGERVDMEQGGALPGGGGSRFLKARGPVALLFAPVLGLLFAVFLPLSGIAMTLWLALRKLGSVAADLSAQSLSFGWRPSESYLGGRRRKRAKKKYRSPRSGL